jgi:hypothetical protein
MRNSIRFDLSDWLIHFFRDVDLSNNTSPVDMPEHMGFSNIHENEQLPALYMLRCAIRHGYLWATWSFRNSARTIYGQRPAVCFTEMPIAAFLESSFHRAQRGEAMSTFALVFPKINMFSLGARQVLYGLDASNGVAPSRDGNVGPRVFDPLILPESEQYRYVSYNPASPRPVDWSHEREWRWPYLGDVSAYEAELADCGPVEGVKDMPGLDLYNGTLNSLGVIVKSRDQVPLILHDILVLVDRGIINQNTYSFVLATDDLPSYADIRSPDALSDTIAQYLINLSPFFELDPNASAIDARFGEIAQEIEINESQIQSGEPGGCWLWILDNTSPFTRALLATRRVIVNNDGKYLAQIPEFTNSRGLRKKEEMTRALADKIKTEFGVECGYFSVSGHQDPSWVPFYNSDHIDNQMFYNNAWNYS